MNQGPDRARGNTAGTIDSWCNSQADLACCHAFCNTITCAERSGICQKAPGQISGTTVTASTLELHAMKHCILISDWTSGTDLTKSNLNSSRNNRPYILSLKQVGLCGIWAVVGRHHGDSACMHMLPSGTIRLWYAWTHRCHYYRFDCHNLAQTVLPTVWANLYIYTNVLIKSAPRLQQQYMRMYVFLPACVQQVYILLPSCGGHNWQYDAP